MTRSERPFDANFASSYYDIDDNHNKSTTTTMKQAPTGRFDSPLGTIHKRTCPGFFIIKNFPFFYTISAILSRHSTAFCRIFRAGITTNSQQDYNTDGHGIHHTAGDSWQALVCRKRAWRADCAAVVNASHQVRGARVGVQIEADILSSRPGQVPNKTFGEILARYADEVSPGKRGARWEQIRLRALASDPIARYTPV